MLLQQAVRVALVFAPLPLSVHQHHLPTAHSKHSFDVHTQHPAAHRADGEGGTSHADANNETGLGACRCQPRTHTRAQ